MTADTRRDTDGVTLSRNWSVFLVLAGAFNWVIWPRFAHGDLERPTGLVR